jgi:tripartite-type tricarboxylate transporter receptor subunit TctC
MRRHRFIILLGGKIMATMSMNIAVAALAAMTTPAAAQAPNLAGKTVNLIIGFGPGGGYDLWGRVVARHISKHLPGTPTVVPQNMPGAGSLNAANHIYNVAPKDGTAMGIITGAAVLAPITGTAGARFDPTKITWVGTPTTDTHICIAYNSPRCR